MLKLLTPLLLILSCFVGELSADGEAPKKQEINFTVEGLCGMCESRIEGALDVKGIVVADWNQETGQMKVVFKPQLITEDEIHSLINAVGHDTEKSRASDEQYASLHGCCKYRDMKKGECTQDQ